MICSWLTGLLLLIVLLLASLAIYVATPTLPLHDGVGDEAI